MGVEFIHDSMSVFEIGSQKCEPGHEWSIGYIDRYLIHYVISGKGKFICDNKEYELERGNAFLITGEKGGYYQADFKDPWHYMWINISGGMAEKFLYSIALSRKTPIYKTTNPDIIEKCFFELLDSKNENSFIISSIFFKLMGEMLRYSEIKRETDKKSTEEYVNMCKNYICVNSYRKISVKDLCSYIGIEHSYLYRLFKSKEKMSPYEYIIDYKIKKAKQLLTETNLSIGEVANSVGYGDALAFSKLFSKREKISPSEFREKNQN